MSNKYSQVSQELGANGYQFEMGKYISEGWKLGTSIVGYWLLFGIVSFAIGFVTGFIPIVGPLANSLVISPALAAGLILFIKHKKDSGESDFGLIFKAFNKVGQLFLLNLITGLIGLILFIPAIISMIGMFSVEDFMALASKDTEAIQAFAQTFIANISMFMGGVSISMLLVSVLSILLTFSMYFVVVGDLSAIGAIKASIAVAKKKFFAIFGFGIVLGLINLAGALALVIGLIVTIPVTMAAMYLMFHHIIVERIEESEGTGVAENDVLDA